MTREAFEITINRFFPFPRIAISNDKICQLCTIGYHNDILKEYMKGGIHFITKFQS